MSKSKLFTYFQIRIFNFFQWFILILFFISYIYFQLSNKIIDGDIASDIILGKILSVEHHIITPNYLYGTELRTIGNNITLAFYFLFTDDWHKVLISSNITWIVFLLLSYYYLCTTLNIKKYFPLTAALLMLPYNEDYNINMIELSYYAPHITFIFIITAFVFHFNKLNQRYKQIILLIFAAIFSFLSCLDGYRVLCCILIPLLLVSSYLLYKKEYKYLKFCIISYFLFFSGLIAWGINKLILSEIYYFKNFQEICWTDSFTNELITNLKQLLNSILVGFGYYSDLIFSKTSVNNFLSLLFITILFRYCFLELKNKKYTDIQQIIILLFVTMFFVFSFICIFSNFPIVPRYFFYISFFSIIIANLYISFTSNEKMKTILIILFCILLFNNINKYYTKYYGTEITIDEMKMKDLLIKNKYYSGYASFPSLNILTCLTNGKIQMYNFDYISAYSNDKYLNFETEVAPIFQHKSHLEKKPYGKIFLLLRNEEYNNIPTFLNLKNPPIIYKSNIHTVLGFDNFEDINKALYKN